MPGESGSDTSRKIELEVLRLLLQEEREHPDYLEAEKIYSRIAPDYGREAVRNTIEELDNNPSSSLNYWSSSEERVCSRDLGETAGRLNQILDEEQDPFP